MSESPLKSRHGAAGAGTGLEDGVEVTLDFGDVAAERRAIVEAAGLLDLSDRALLQFEGPDAARFLHNMSTQDIQGLAVGRAAYMVFATKKGKMISDAHVLRVADESFLVELPGSRVEPLTGTLGKYIALENAELIDRSGELGELLVTGPAAVEELTKAGIAASDLEVFDHREADLGGITVRVLRPEPWTGQPTMLLITSRERLADVWDHFVEAGASAGLRPIGRTAFHAARVEAGFPWFGIDMDEERLPMEAGLEPRAISYTKGCYVGQEVIARVKYKGHVNRHLVRLAVEGAAAVDIGAEVRLGDDTIGQVTSAAPAFGTERSAALAYLKHGHEASGTAVQIGDREAVVIV